MAQRSRPTDPDIEQARYLAGELNDWVDRLSTHIEAETDPNTVLAKRRELYDVHRQLKALQDTFPQAFA